MSNPQSPRDMVDSLRSESDDDSSSASIDDNDAGGAAEENDDNGQEKGEHGDSDQIAASSTSSRSNRNGDGEQEENTALKGKDGERYQAGSMKRDDNLPCQNNKPNDDTEKNENEDDNEPAKSIRKRKRGKSGKGSKGGKGQSKGSEGSKGGKTGHRAKKSATSDLVPRYQAPKKLSCESLEKIRPPVGGLKAMIEAAKCQDANQGMQQAKFVAEQSRQKNGGMNPTFTASYGSVTTTKKKRKKSARAEAASSFGQGWFHMAATPMTEEVKQDLALIRNRNYLDPKKFYKSADSVKDGAKVQVGTVVEGATEYYSSRLTKKQRRTNLVDEIMADPSSSDYAKKKYKNMARANTEKSKAWKKNNPKSFAKSFKALK